MKHQLLATFNHMKSSGSIPSKMKVNDISLAHKKDGDKRIIDNNRPITLLNHDYKIYTKILSNRMKKSSANLTAPTAVFDGRKKHSYPC